MFKVLGKMTKEWWLKMAESEGDSEVGCGATPDYLKDDGLDIVAADGTVDYYSDRVKKRLDPDFVSAAKTRKTGFDKYLEKQLENPVFKEEYEKALKEIQEYDRRENERRRIEAEREKEPPGKPS